MSVAGTAGEWAGSAWGGLVSGTQSPKVCTRTDTDSLVQPLTAPEMCVTVQPVSVRDGSTLKGIKAEPVMLRDTLNNLQCEQIEDTFPFDGIKREIVRDSDAWYPINSEPATDVTSQNKQCCPTGHSCMWRSARCGPVADTDTCAVVKSETNADTCTCAFVKSDSNTDTVVHGIIKGRTDTDMGAFVKGETNTDTDRHAIVKSETDTDTAHAVVKSETDTDMHAIVKGETDTDTAHAVVKSETDTDMHAIVKGETDTGTDTCAIVKSETDSDTDTQGIVKSGTDTDTDTWTNIGSEAVTDSNTGTAIESDTDTYTWTVVERDTVRSDTCIQPVDDPAVSKTDTAVSMEPLPPKEGQERLPSEPQPADKEVSHNA